MTEEKHNHESDGGSSPRQSCPACMKNHNEVSDKYAAEGLCSPAQPEASNSVTVLGGTCFKHGEYKGSQCPKWPECAKPEASPEPQAREWEVCEDKEFPGTWRAEYINTKTGDCFVTVFAGPDAQNRAREFAQYEGERSLMFVLIEKNAALRHEVERLRQERDALKESTSVVMTMRLRNQYSEQVARAEAAESRLRAREEEIARLKAELAAR